MPRFKYHPGHLALAIACLIPAVIPKNSLAFASEAGVDANAAHLSARSSQYADIADLATGAPIVVVGLVKSAKLLKATAESPPQPGYVHVLVTAQVKALIRGEGGISPEIRYLVAMQTRTNGRIEKLKNRKVLVFSQATGMAGAVQLVSRNAQMMWTQEREDTARSVAGELLKNDAPPRVTGVGDAFFSPGTVAGDSETQIFLKTANGAPVSLSVERRRGQPPKWGVSLGELVGETAAPPERNTLLWYRLACSLPDILPDHSARDLSGADAVAVREDYAFVMQALGTCGRTL